MSKSNQLDFEGQQKTVTAAGTKEPLTGDNTEVLAVIIKALTTNTGKIYVGGSNVDSTHCVDLDPGDALPLSTENIGFPINLGKIYVDAAVNGEGVNFAYLRL